MLARHDEGDARGAGFSRATLTGALLFTTLFAGAPAALAGPTTALEIGGQVDFIAYDVQRRQAKADARCDRGRHLFFACWHRDEPQLHWGAVSSRDVLPKAPGSSSTPRLGKNDILRNFVTVIGSDGYEAVFGVGELDPAFGGDQIITGCVRRGWTKLLTDEGFAKLVAPRAIRRAAGSSPTSTKIRRARRVEMIEAAFLQRF